MKKVFDKDGTLRIRFASNSKEQIKTWLGDTNYDEAIKHSTEVSDPVFGKALEFPCKIN